MAKGTVKWFNNAKGYGFIIADEGGDDLFVHYSYVNMEGYRTLKAGQRVEYDTQEAPKGLHAVNIRTTTKDEATAQAASPSAIDGTLAIDTVSKAEHENTDQDPTIAENAASATTEEKTNNPVEHA